MEDLPGRPVVFLAFANDRDDRVGYLRNLPDEARRLRDVLQTAEQAGLCEVVVRTNSTADDIFRVFQDPKYRNRVAILHYGGHANGYQLLLESAAGHAAAANADGLAAFLAQQRGLQLIVLNGCSTQQQTRGLLEASVSAVISTSQSIDDNVATEFAFQFYRGLAGGATIRAAYNEAEAAIKTMKSGKTRDLHFAGSAEAEAETNRWPWDLYIRDGFESADQWNLPQAVNDPLFGLPLLPEQDLPDTPYRHLHWFTRKDAEVFFGRGHQIRELYDRLTAPRTPPILLFYGQSGVGKSSVLDAGLIPRLEQSCEVQYLRRGASGLSQTLHSAFVSEAADAPVQTAWRVTEEKSGKPLVVFLDQVEEVFTQPIPSLPDELEQLLRVLHGIFAEVDRRPKGKLVLGFRKEWLAEIEAKLAAHELPRTKVFLQPLDRRGLVEVVQGPARSRRLRERYGLSVETGLAEIIADDLLEDTESAIAPTLQILLTKLWAKASEANHEKPVFDRALYQQLKRDGILLRDFLDQQIAAFRERHPQAVASGLLLDILTQHTTALGTAGQCSLDSLQRRYAHLGAALPEMLQRCQDLNLLTIAADARRDGGRSTRLAHDTLAPLVRELFDASDKPGQRARRILASRAVDWTDGRTGTPLDNADLAVVVQGQSGTHELSEAERRLVAASHEHVSRADARRRWARRAWGAASVAIAVTAAVAVFQWTTAARMIRAASDTTAQIAFEIDSELRAIANTEKARASLLGVVKRLESTLGVAADAKTRFEREFATGALGSATSANQPSGYQNAFAIAFKQHEANPDDATWMYNLAKSHRALGELALRGGDDTKASEHFTNAQRVAQLLVVADTAELSRRELAESHAALGDLHFARADIETAQKHFNEALTIVRALATETRDERLKDEWTSALVTSLKQVADMEQRLPAPRIDVARSLYAESLAIAKGLVDKAPDNLQWQYALSNAYDSRGTLILNFSTPPDEHLEDLRAAQRDFQESIEITKRLSVSEPGVALWRDHLADRFRKLAQVQIALRQVDDAIRAYVMALSHAPSQDSRDPVFDELEAADLERALELARSTDENLEHRKWMEVEFERLPLTQLESLRRESCNAAARELERAEATSVDLALRRTRRDEHCR